MNQKTKSFSTLLSLFLGSVHHRQQPLRFMLIGDLLRLKGLRHADEILLNTLSFTTIRNHKATFVLSKRMPLSQRERDVVKALLIIILPRDFQVEHRNESILPQDHQLTVHFMKTHA